jgi:hypothetical protein
MQDQLQAVGVCIDAGTAWCARRVRLYPETFLARQERFAELNGLGLQDHRLPRRNV